MRGSESGPRSSADRLAGDAALGRAVPSARWQFQIQLPYYIHIYILSVG